MMQLIYGHKGSGKSKRLLDMANAEVDSTAGNIVYIDDNNRCMYDLRHEIRFINTADYDIDNMDMLYGFVCGILSGDFDISSVYIDGLKKLKKEGRELEELMRRFAKLFDDVDAYVVISGERSGARVHGEVYHQIATIRHACAMPADGSHCISNGCVAARRFVYAAGTNGGKGMQLISTRGAGQTSASQATLTGLAPDGGLYVPSVFPHIDDWNDWTGLAYEALCARVLGLFFDDIPELGTMTKRAYARFDTAQPPVRRIDDTHYMLELWHGPTLAFKDMALCLLPRLMTAAMAQSDRDILVLVATSGDTGKAAARGLLRRRAYANRRVLSAGRRFGNAAAADGYAAGRQYARACGTRQF